MKILKNNPSIYIASTQSLRSGLPLYFGGKFYFMELNITNKKGKTFTVYYDDNDHETLSKFRWYISSGKYLYVRTTVSGKKVMMHRVVMKVNDTPFLVDHKNHNTLDNRKDNLRVCTPSQNLCNVTGFGSSKYLGVTWNKEKIKWQVSIKPNGGKVLLIGRYDDEILAAKIYDAAAKYYHGEYANLNFKE